MLTTTSRYRQLQNGNMRPVSWQLRFSFDRAFDDAIDFFTLDTSVLDGTDILAPSDSNVIAQWDKYAYKDFTSRAVQLEWTRERDVPYSASQAMADITLNNYDNYFTRNSSSPLEPYILPRRPVRILAGFGGDNLPQFVGLTETVPKTDKASRKATVHAVDFLTYLYEKTLDEAVTLVDKTTDEVLDYIFQLFGILPAQYVLDVGQNEIAFVFFDKGTKFGDIVNELMQAELGSLYMDEVGIIRFKNRERSVDSPTYTLNGSNIVDYKLSDETTIINVVTLKASIREVQTMEPVYTAGVAIELPVGSSEQFFTFNDPVTTIDTITTYTANTAQDGSGSDVTGDVAITSTDLFSTSVKVTFNNTSGGIAYVLGLEIEGTPATIVETLDLRYQDDDSIDEFDEHVYAIDNNFIQSKDGADSLALTILQYFKDYGSSIDLTIKSDVSLQNGDRVRIGIDNTFGIYTITKMNTVLSLGHLEQHITARIISLKDPFTLDQSILDGNDVLQP